MWRSNGEGLLGSRLPGGYLDDQARRSTDVFILWSSQNFTTSIHQHLTEFLRQLTSKVDIINSGVLLITSSILPDNSRYLLARGRGVTNLI